MPKFGIRKRRFNPVYFHLRKYLNDHKIRNILLYGSSSSAKSYSVSQALLIDGINNDYSSMFFRKEGTSIRDSIYEDINEIISEEFLNMGDIVKKYDLEYRYNNRRIRYRGLDKPDKAKGLKSYQKLYLDELDQFAKKDWNELQRRLRGRKGQQVIASWNPVSEKHWIKVDLIDKKEWKDLPKFIEGNPYSVMSDDSFIKISSDGRTILIKTVYDDNKWVVGGVTPEGEEFGLVDEQALAHYEDMKINNPEDYRVYGLALWGRIKNDSPFFYNMKKWEGVVDPEIKIRKDLPLYVSYDFNIDECAATISQLIPFECINIIDSLAVYGGTRELTNIVKRKYGDNIILVTGDASGRQGSAIAGINKDTGNKYNNYTLIQEILKIPNSKKRFLVNKANKSHFMSYTLCNDALYRLPIFFHPDAKDLYDEMHSARVEETSSGLIRLKKGVDEMNNRVDSFRYLLDCMFPNQIGKKDSTPKSVRLMATQVSSNFPELFEYYQSISKVHENVIH